MPNTHTAFSTISVPEPLDEPAGLAAPKTTDAVPFDEGEVPAGFTYALLASAAEHGVVVEFTYEDAHGEQSSRCVLPTYVTDELLTGDDFDRDEVRSFRLDRIVGGVAPQY